MQVIRLSPTIGVAGQIYPEDMQAIADAGYRVVINNRPDAEVPGQPSSEELQRAAEAAGLDYRYYPITAANFPGDNPQAMAALFDDEQRPVFAFCRSGTRSSNLWIRTRGEPEAIDSARTHAQALGFDVSLSLR
jgi:sulfide:quinone oxidoreductase